MSRKVIRGGVFLTLLAVAGGCSSDAAPQETSSSSGADSTQTPAQAESSSASDDQTSDTESSVDASSSADDVQTEPVVREVKSYEEGLVLRGIASAKVYYPDPVGQQKLPVVIVMHGWMGNKEKMAWIGSRAAEQGFAAMVVTGSNHEALLAKPQDWIANYEASLDSLDGENERPQSPLFERLDMEKISLVGYSMGGGGALYFADQTAVPLACVVALAPFSRDKEKPGAKVKAPTLVLTGTHDKVAPPAMGQEFFGALDQGVPKKYVEIEYLKHTDFETDGALHGEIFNEALAWLRLHGR